MVMMAGAMRVAVSFAVACAKDDGTWTCGRGAGPGGDVPVFPDLAGHGLVAGVPDADRGQDRPEGAGEGQVMGPQRDPALLPFLAGAAARAASRATPRVIPTPAAQAASSCRTRSGEPERSIGPVPGPAPRSGA